MEELIELIHSFPNPGSHNMNRNLLSFMMSVPELYYGDNFQIQYGPSILYWNFNLKLELYNLNVMLQGMMLGKFISFGPNTQTFSFTYLCIQSLFSSSTDDITQYFYLQALTRTLKSANKDPHKSDLLLLHSETQAFLPQYYNSSM